MYTPIRDYAAVGNLRSTILISKSGSIDWAPAPFIDSPSIFAALLDEKIGGFWSIAPTDDYKVDQRYIDETNILVTTFRTDTSVLELTDFIPIEDEKEYLPAEKDTTFKIKRRVTCKHGTCNLKMTMMPRFNYARGETTLSPIEGGVFIENESMHGVLVMDHPVEITDGSAVAEITLNENEFDFIVFRYNKGEIDIQKDNNEHHDKDLEVAISFWRAWARQCDLETCPIEKPWHEEVIRSALILKMLFFDPIGTVAAAPTTSLPEEIGGIRNWDYRFTWLRDSAFTFEAFFRLGHTMEAGEYISWLMNKCQVLDIGLHPENLKIMYGLHGDNTLEEETLSHLSGYMDSKPVRIGNAAHIQDQWDIYGSILDVIWKLHELKGKESINEGMYDIISSIADHVVKIWRKPDKGLWEVRGGADHFVYSKVMCWVALDRACKLQSAHGFNGDTELWSKEREAIKAEVYEKGWNSVGTFTQSYNSNNVDAALLLLPSVGFIEGNDPKMISTIAAIKKTLTCGEGLLRRYAAYDGLPGNEGAFFLASFWLVDAIALSGQVEDARALFDIIISKSNHVDLFSEEIDPKSGDFLGNFPQAYTHIGLIKSAFLLGELGQSKW